MNSESFIKFGNENDFDFIIRRVGGNAGKAYILKEGETVSPQSNYFIKNNSILTDDVLVEIINSIQMDVVNYSVGPRSLSKRELIEYVEEGVKKMVKDRNQDNGDIYIDINEMSYER